MDEYYDKIQDTTLNGAIFMAVCRGKVSFMEIAFIF